MKRKKKGSRSYYKMKEIWEKWNELSTNPELSGVEQCIKFDSWFIKFRKRREVEMAIGSKKRIAVDMNVKQYVTQFTNPKTGRDIDKPREKLMTESIRNEIDPLEAVRLIVDILEENN